MDQDEISNDIFLLFIVSGTLHMYCDISEQLFRFATTTVTLFFS